jgi:hypothetical protein
LNVSSWPADYTPGINTSNGILRILGSTVNAVGSNLTGGISGNQMQGGGEVHINHPSGSSHGSARGGTTYGSSYTGIGPGADGSCGSFYDKDGSPKAFPTANPYEW